MDLLTPETATVQTQDRNARILPRELYNQIAKEAMVKARLMADDIERSKRLKFRGAAAILPTREDNEVVLSGPAGTGKSMACLWLLHRRAITYPGFRGAILRKTRTSLNETGLTTWEDHILGPQHPLVIDGTKRRYRVDYIFPNDARIVVGGMDKPSKILSAEYDMIFVQQAEELDEDEWEILTTRLRNAKMPFQQLLGDCNPGGQQHWLKLRAESGKTLMLESRHEDNPWLYQGGSWTDDGRRYIERLDNLTGVLHRRLRLGQWASAEGAVYEEFDRHKHVIRNTYMGNGQRGEIWNPNTRRFRVIDFGYTNPAVIQWWMVDEDGRMFMYREFYHTGKLVSELADYMNMLDRGNESVEATICDHDAEGRATLEALGVPTTPANKGVLQGIEMVQRRLRPAGDGRPRLFILSTAPQVRDPALVEKKVPTSTIEEFDGYVWANNRTKEEPVKMHDHGLDALRYAVMYLDGGHVMSFKDIGGSGMNKSDVGAAPRDWNLGVQVPTGNRWKVK